MCRFVVVVVVFVLFVSMAEAQGPVPGTSYWVPSEAQYYYSHDAQPAPYGWTPPANPVVYAIPGGDGDLFLNGRVNVCSGNCGWVAADSLQRYYGYPARVEDSHLYALWPLEYWR